MTLGTCAPAGHVSIDLSKNCLRAAFPALLAAPIVLKWTDDL
jgi:hypothetical protein